MSHKHILNTIAALVCLGALVYFQIRQWRSFDWNRFQQASHVHRHIAIAIGLVHSPVNCAQSLEHLFAASSDTDLANPLSHVYRIQQICVGRNEESLSGHT